MEVDTPLAIRTNSESYFYQRDHQGSITSLTDSNQNKVQEYTYTDAYGTTQVTQTQDTNNPYGYTGRELDDTDLYYYRARYYDPTTQRFLSQDPIGFASGDFNFYRYVGNSPGNFRDPSGNFAVAAIPLYYWLAGAGAIGTYAYFKPPPAYLPMLPGSSSDTGAYCASSSGDKMLSPGEAKRLADGGAHPHTLKENARQDLYKRKNGDIVVKPKGGNGPGEPTGLNINDF